jgi:hypothetical protein
MLTTIDQEFFTDAILVNRSRVTVSRIIEIINRIRNVTIRRIKLKQSRSIRIDGDAIRPKGRNLFVALAGIEGLENFTSVDAHNVFS